MKYVPRPGIVCVFLCGNNVLVPLREAAKECKSILPLNLMGSAVWGAIDENFTLERLLDTLHIFSKAPDEELIAKIDDYCQKLLEKGFIIPKPEETGSETT